MLVAMIVGCGTWAAWAAQPPQPAKTAATAPAKSDAPYLTRITSQDSVPAPAYPAGVKVNGKLEIELLVGNDGHVKDVKVLKAEPAADKQG